MDSRAYERPPALLAACLAVAGGYVVASLFLGLLLAPLALITWTGAVFAGDPSAPRFGLLVPWLLLLALHPLLAAWIAQHGLRFFRAGTVTYARACGAMFLSLVVTVLAAVALPPEAALPAVGYGWSGALVAGIVLTRQRFSERFSHG